MTTPQEQLAEALVSAAGSHGAVDEYLELAAEALMEAAADSDQPVGEMLIRAIPELPIDLLAVPGTHERRAGVGYEVRTDRSLEDLAFVADPGLFDDFSLDPNTVHHALEASNTALHGLEVFGSALRVSVAELLQLRNLSGLVGAVVVSELERLSDGKLMSNPHQDGYPDLLAQTPDALVYQERLHAEGRSSAKEAWTNPGFGGVEVKATMGNVPPASEIPKPGIGDERGPTIRSFDWKAHHRETNNLLAIAWDFIDGIPTMSAAFYRNDLVEDDWGRTVTPRAGGGRTTSVSVMKQSGVGKMAAGWLIRSLDDGMRNGLRSGRLLV